VPADQPLIGLGIAEARRPQKHAGMAGDPIPRAPTRGTHPRSNMHAHGSETYPVTPRAVRRTRIAAQVTTIDDSDQVTDRTHVGLPAPAGGTDGPSFFAPRAARTTVQETEAGCRSPASGSSDEGGSVVKPTAPPEALVREYSTSSLAELGERAYFRPSRLQDGASC
jgi:hypothetical protein